jgi:hypothetical protein
MCEMARQEGKLSKFIYPNDANEKQDVFAGYEEGCVERLRDVSRKYDPERVIQRLQGGGGKVGRWVCSFWSEGGLFSAVREVS